MKVLYQNKVGSLILLEGLICRNCIYYPKNTPLTRCEKVGLMELCVGYNTYYEFT